jgi:hypothetical protein
MSQRTAPDYARAQARVLAARLAEPRRHLQVVAGPPQAGKTTLVRQALAAWGDRARYASADEPTLRDRAWIPAQWEAARLAAREAGKRGAVLALDEIQKIPDWSETVKRLWDEDTAQRLPLRVVILGSAPLLIQRGLTESLAGRFELVPVGHWTLAEMREAFGFGLEQYLFFGGYPGTAPLAYKGLLRVEQAFRTLKHGVELRPIYHHRLDTRIRAHVTLCLLAYLLERVVELETKQPFEPVRRLLRRLLRRLRAVELTFDQQTVWETSALSPEARRLLALLKIPPLPRVLPAVTA